MFSSMIMVIVLGRSICEGAGLSCGTDICFTGYYCDRVEGRCSPCSLAACRQTTPSRDCQCAELRKKYADSTVARGEANREEHSALSAVLKEQLTPVLVFLKVELAALAVIQVTVTVLLIVTVRVCTSMGKFPWKSKDVQWLDNINPRDAKINLEPNNFFDVCYQGEFSSYPRLYATRPAENISLVEDLPPDYPNCKQCARENQSDTTEKYITEDPSMGSHLCQNCSV